MILNFKKQGNIKTFSRARKGWCKKVTGIDKTQKGGYSILGEFIKLGNFDTYLTNGIYLDCSKSGRGKKNPDIDYHLFKVQDNEITLLKHLSNPENNWVIEFWDLIEEELGKNKVTPQQLANLIHEETDDEEVITELINILTDENSGRCGFRNHFDFKSYMYDIPCLELTQEYFDNFDLSDFDVSWNCEDYAIDKKKVSCILERWFNKDSSNLGDSIYLDIKECSVFDIRSWEFRRHLRELFNNEAGFYFTRRGANAVGTMNRVIVVLCGFNSVDNIFVVRHFDYYD